MTFLEKLEKSNEKMTRSMINHTISSLCPEDLGYEEKSPCICLKGYKPEEAAAACRKCWEREMEASV